MQEYEVENYDCIVVGGGASGLAAISAMADLGINDALLLEKEAALGGRLMDEEGDVSLSGVNLSGKILLRQFLTLLDIYEVKTKSGTEVLSVSLDKSKEFPYTLNLLNSSEKSYSCKYLVLALKKSIADALLNGISAEDKAESKELLSRTLFSLEDMLLAECNLASVQTTRSIEASLNSGGKIGRTIGEALLSEKKNRG